MASPVAREGLKRTYDPLPIDYGERESIISNSSGLFWEKEFLFLQLQMMNNDSDFYICFREDSRAKEGQG